MSSTARRMMVLLATAALQAALIGCAPQSPVYDPEKLLGCQRIAVMPFIDAPGYTGGRSGMVESGVVLSELSRLGNLNVEGAGRLRKALADSSANPWDMAVQRRLVRKKDIDLVMVGEVTEYRFTKDSHTVPLMVVSHTWTETISWVSVNLRLVDPESGRLVYAAEGSGKSKEGYGPAMVAATRASLAPLRDLLQKHKMKGRKE